MSLDFDETLRLAASAEEEPLERRWEVYLALVERAEARPENQSEAEKSWAEGALEAHQASS